MKKAITIVGSYNVGLFLKGQRLPEVGETITADQFVEGAGGKGSNQAIAAAMFGADVKFIGRVGVDSYGKYALDLYKKVGISRELVTIDKSIHSGISVILIDKDGRNMISVALGANLKLSKQDIDRAKEVMEKSLLVGFQLENKLDTVFYGIRRAHELGTMTFLDPAPAAKLPDGLYPCIDIIKPNETEAGILTGIEVKDVRSAAAAGRWLLERGAGTGRRYHRGGRYLQRVIHVRPGRGDTAGRGHPLRQCRRCIVHNTAGCDRIYTCTGRGGRYAEKEMVRMKKI